MIQSPRTRTLSVETLNTLRSSAPGAMTTSGEEERLYSPALVSCQGGFLVFRRNTCARISEKSLETNWKDKMEKDAVNGIGGWLSTKFKNPLTPLFFILGSLLILMGISTGIQVPILQQLSATPDYRGISLGLGIAFVAAAVLFYYLSLNSSPTTSNIGRPEDTSLDFAPRFASLWPTQREILAFIEKKPNQEWVRQD